MGLPPGARLGSYEILSALGAGGMGEVYRARDSKLNRDVAIKVLPDAFALDAERLARFTREAQTLAALNHPHIAHVHGLEESGGTRALVMELVEGEDLSVLIARGPMPFADALPIAKQIAEALEAAHEAGIIHRDLKPANIKVRADGTVKVLDFGLAKAVDPAASSSAAAMNSPTITTPAMTQAGLILGTAAYMSPEQAKGRVVDRRADIWAFGAVLYEMLTRNRAFAGNDTSEVLADVIKGEPDWTQLPDALPANIPRLLRRCLAKDPKQRLSDASTLRLEIDEALTGTVTTAGSPATGSVWQLRVAWSAAAVFLVAAIAMAARLAVTERVPEPAVLTFDIPTPGFTAPNQIALSPTGSHIAALVSGVGNGRLWVRELARPDGKTIAGTDGAAWPFWSADGRYVGFFTAGKLKKADMLGGPPQTITDALGLGGTWNRDDVIIFQPASTGPLFRVPATGGTPQAVTQLDAARQEVSHRHPFFLPDGRHFLYLAVSSARENSGVVVGSLDSTERKFLVTTLFRAAFAPPDHLLFLRDATLLAQPFDPERLELSGEPVPIAEGVGSFEPFSAAGFTVAGNGMLAYRSGSDLGADRFLKWFDRSGQESVAVETPGAYFSPALSPDLKHVAVAQTASSETDGSNNTDIWALDLARGTRTRLTTDLGTDSGPIWSPDGSQIIFWSMRDGLQSNLFRKAVGGLAPEELLLKSDSAKYPWAWSGDGRFLVYEDNESQGNNDLWVLPLAGDKTPAAVVRSPFHDWGGAFSPDGRWLAYTSDASGQEEVYLQGFPDAKNRLQISTAGGRSPRWRRDGRELFFEGLSGGEIMAVDFAVSGDRVTAGIPHRLFSALTASLFGWDVTPDGQRFLIVTSLRPTANVITPITMIVNWDRRARGQK